MDSLLVDILKPLGIVGVVAAGVIWWLKGFLEKKLDAHFKQVQQVSEVALELRKSRLQQRSDFLLEAQRRATEARNLCLRLVERPDVALSRRYREAAEQYADHMYAWQLLTNAATYRGLHDFKRQLDALAMHLGVALNAAGAAGSIAPFVSGIEIAHGQLQELLRTEFEGMES